MKLSIIFLFVNIITIAQTVNIPDPIFKDYLINNAAINTISDGEIQVSEANAFSGTIDCFNLGITDLTGIEYFTNLSSLKFSNNQVSSVDLSNNTNLVLLYCSYNQLTQLDLSSNTNLYNLICYDNDIASLDLSNNPNLGQLECSLNNIDSLDLSNNTNLTKILCNTNDLHYLNVANGNNTAVTWINFDAQFNPNLTCVEVDDTAFSNQTWGNRISPPAVYSLDCQLFSSIAEAGSNQAIKVYPVPATNTLKIETPIDINEKVSIYNSLGVLIDEIQLTGSQTLNIASLKSGMYFIKLGSNDKAYGKFIKE